MSFCAVTRTAACVISGAADRVPERIGALVYLDAFVLQNGQSLHDTLPEAPRSLQLELARDVGDGWKVPPIPAEVFNVNLADRAWVDRQCTMQPLATFQQPLALSAGLAAPHDTTFISPRDLPSRRSGRSTSRPRRRGGRP
jgi:hypothetical protein